MSVRVHRASDELTQRCGVGRLVREAKTLWMDRQQDKAVGLLLALDRHFSGMLDGSWAVDKQESTVRLPPVSVSPLQT